MSYTNEIWYHWYHFPIRAIIEIKLFKLKIRLDIDDRNRSWKKEED